MPATIDWYHGDRAELRPLFSLAEDSATALDSYLPHGRILVAASGSDLVGHLQVVDTETPGHAEIKNMAVREDQQRRGIGRLLVTEAITRLAAEDVVCLRVATATADIGNLRFYQRLGFRMRSVERDTFTEATGYPPGILIDGIPLRDQVWLDRPLARPSSAGDPPASPHGDDTASS